MAARSSRRDAKAEALRAHGALHPRPQAVQAPLFASHDFFDPRDLVQVKYEMLRQVDVEGAPVARTADAFGVSRPTFYQTQAAFKQRGIRRPGAAETRAARRPQARRRGDGLCGDAARGGPGAQCPGVAAADSRALWARRAPAESRARLATRGKKTPLSDPPTSPRRSPRPPRSWRVTKRCGGSRWGSVVPTTGRASGWRSCCATA